MTTLGLLAVSAMAVGLALIVAVAVVALLVATRAALEYLPRRVRNEEMRAHLAEVTMRYLVVEYAEAANLMRRKRGLVDPPRPSKPVEAIPSPRPAPDKNPYAALAARRVRVTHPARSTDSSSVAGVSKVTS